MFLHGRLNGFFSVVMGVITMGASIAGYGRSSLDYRQSQVEVLPTQRAIASTRARDLVITITNADGRLRGGDNDVCVLFAKRETQEAVNVQNVSVDFTLLVGRIQEEPIKAQLAQERTGRYCGHINLGKQHYVPASYYAFVRYTDAGHKTRKERLFLSVK